MGHTFALALRNLLRNLLPRNRRRSLVTLFATVLGLVAVLRFGGYMRNINYALRSDFARLSGHLQIQHAGYFRVGSGLAAYGIRDYERVLRVVRSDPVLAPMLAVATPTPQFGGIAGNFAAGVSRTVYAAGAVVADQNRMRQWNDHGLRMLSQPLTLEGSAADQVVVGTGVARVLQPCVALKVPDCAAAMSAPADAGSAPAPALPDDIASLAAAQAPSDAAGANPTRVEILATGSRRAPNVAAVRVLRAEFQGIKELDDVAVAMHLGQAQKLIFGTEPPQVTAIELQLHHTSQLPAAQARLSELMATTLKGEPLEVVYYETLNPFYGQTIAMFAAIFGFISVLIGGIVLFTVGNTTSMAVVERTAEIGTLRAIGLRRGGIRAMFVSEGLVIGALIGTGVAIAAAAAVNALGLTWTPPGRVEPVAPSVRVASERPMMLACALGLVAVAALSAILPAARARLTIVDALRHV